MVLRSYRNNLLVKLYHFIQENIALFFGLVLIVGLFIYLVLGALAIEETTRFLFQLILSRTFLLIWLVLVMVTWAKTITENKFVLPNSGFNLAIFRIIFFSVFSIGGIFAFSKLKSIISPWVDVPISNMQAPLGLGWVIDFIPLSNFSVRVAVWLFVISAWGAFLGVKTRLSIFLFTVSAFYIFGVPNLFGKINHTHHIFWIPFILLFSHCNDKLSIDAYLRKKEITVYPNKYTTPFILLWIFMGLVYFFPGFWKIWDCGFDWVMTNNLRNQMHLKWLSLGNWTPFFRIDYYPLIYKTGALFTVLFELSFIVLVMQPKARLNVFFAGILFHVASLLFMKIFFVILIVAYASMVNWEKILPNRHRSEMEIYWRDIFRPNKKTTAFFGGFLIVGFVVAGFTKTNSWPFTCYPTFAYLVEEKTSVLLFEEKLPKGETLQLNNQKLKEKYSPERFRYWENEIGELHKKGLFAERDLKIEAMIELWCVNAAIINPDSVMVYLKEVSINPDDAELDAKMTRVK